MHTPSVSPASADACTAVITAAVKLANMARPAPYPTQVRGNKKATIVHKGHSVGPTEPYSWSTTQPVQTHAQPTAAQSAVGTLTRQLAAALQMHGNDWDGRDLTGWVITEKMDGCRAYWDGRALYTKSGNVINAPSLTAGLPQGMHLDGEIWAGRGRYETARRFVQYSQQSGDVVFVAFDAPTALGGKAQRIEAAKRAGVRCVDYRIVSSMDELREQLTQATADGAEGFMACDPDAPYSPGRWDVLAKLKRHSLELFSDNHQSEAELKTPSPTPACTPAIHAMLNRANAVLAMDRSGIRAESISFWKGYAKVLNDLTSGAGNKMAAKDAASGGYVQGGGKTAWASLTAGVELLTAAQIVERFFTHGIEIATDTATQFRLEAVQNFPNGVVAIVQSKDEHTPASVDVSDGSGLHDKALVLIGVDIVAEGGATC